MVKVQRGGGERKGQGDGKLMFKARDERFGNLVSKPDEVTAGHYVPWARKQKPGSVKEITFNDDSRRQYLTGFRKRKTERSKVAHKAIVDKELKEKRKERNEKMRELMQNYEERQKKMKRMEEGLGSGDEDEVEDSDDDEDEGGGSGRGDGAEDKTLEFYDNQSGSATTVQVTEMDLTDIHEVSVSASSLPALPKPEKPLGKKAKRAGKGRARQVKKEFLAKSKRAKKKGGRG